MANGDTTPKPTPYQERILAAPEAYDLALAAGRGPGKSWALILLALRHSIQWGADAATLFIRQTINGASEWIRETRHLFGQVAPEARFNQATRLWTFPSGASIEVGHLEVEADFKRYQGRSFSQVLVDEAQQWPSLDVLDLLRSCLRAPRGVPTRMALAANPGGPGHASIARRFVLGRDPWEPFYDERSKHWWVLCPGTFLDNPHLDQAAYLRQLEASTAGDIELRKAWVAGDWAIARGAFFSDSIDEPRVALDGSLWTPEGEWRDRLASKRSLLPARPQFMFWDSGGPAAPRMPIGLSLAHDFGSAAPSVTYVVGRVAYGFEGPDGRWYPPGSVLLLDELATNDPEDLNRGLGWHVAKLSEAICEFASLWQIEPRGVADDAIFARTGSGAGSIADEFRREQVYWERAHKADRVTGWQRMRSMLAAAGSPDQAGLYVSRRCAYWWQTVPALPRDPKRPEDVDTRAADHAADACRYAVAYRPSAPDFSSFRL